MAEGGPDSLTRAETTTGPPADSPLRTVGALRFPYNLTALVCFAALDPMAVGLASVVTHQAPTPKVSTSKH